MFSSCKKEPDPLFTNSVIKGYSETWDFMNETSNITVIASGPYGQKVAETGEIGQFIISGLGNGTYRLDYMKEGYGTIKQYGIQLFGNDTVSAGRVVLFKKYDNYKLPVFRSITIETLDNLYVVIKTDQTKLEVISPIIFFMDVKSTVDYKNYTFSSVNYTVLKDFQGSEYYNIYIDHAGLPFKSGVEVFIIAYVGNPNEISNGYFDKYLGIEQLSTLAPDKHSQVMNFIMP